MTSRSAFIWKKCWKPALTILIPIILSPILFWEGLEIENCGNCEPKWKHAPGAFVILLMAAYWVSECLPLAITALVPVILFPLFQITDTEEVTQSFLNSSVLLLLAGCIVALAFEYSNLHTRIALKVITIVGAQIGRLLLGIMVTSMFLSMWMNNTSTTAMMVPIIYVIMLEFEQPVSEEKEPEEPAVDAGGSVDPAVTTESEVKDSPDINQGPEESKAPEVQPKVPQSQEVVPEPETIEPIQPKHRSSMCSSPKKLRDIKIMFLLGVAAASNIGGTGILTGTATNVIAQSEIEKKKAEVEANQDKYMHPKDCIEVLDLDFLKWAEFNVVPMLICTICSWAVLYIYSTGMPSWMRFWRKKTIEEIHEAAVQRQVARNIESAIRAKYYQLGPMSLHEIFVLAHFLLLVVLWTTQIGWFKLFEEKGSSTKYPHDVLAGLVVCILLFVIPKDKKYYMDFARGGLGEGMKDTVLKWELVETKVPWGPLILIGGGIAISTGIKRSGLARVIATFLQNSEWLSGLAPYQFLIIILVIVAIFTTIASNTATASILSPVLISLAFIKNIHPYYFLVVPTVTASYAFILPISTPPNAIVFDKSDMKQREMAIPGVLLTIVCNLIMFICTHTYDEWIFGFQDYATNTRKCEIIQKPT